MLVSSINYINGMQIRYFNEQFKYIVKRVEVLSVKRLKMTIDVKIKDFQLEDEIMEQVIKDIAGRIADQAQKLGTGRIDYEVVDEE